MRARLAAVALAALAAAACSGDERRAGSPSESGPTSEAASTASTITEPTTVVRAAPALEQALAPTKAKRSRQPYASLAELRWAGAWDEWRARLEVAADGLVIALDQRTTDDRRPRRELARLGRCSEDAARLGAVPTTRLAGVARETSEICERYEIAVAKLRETGLEAGVPSEAVFATDRLLAADADLRTFVPGLDEDVDPLPFLDRRTRKSRIQIRYTYAASKLIREQVTVRCYGPADWRREVREGGGSPGRVAGFVEAHGASGNLAPVTCMWLDRLTYGKGQPSSLAGRARLAHALSTLGHEAQHALGTRNEAVAECSGMQRIKPLARALGARREYADDLAELFWARVYPNAPEKYHSERCGPGEALDLRPKASGWP